MTADVCPKCKSDIVWERRWFLDGATASHVCDDKWHDQPADACPECGSDDREIRTSAKQSYALHPCRNEPRVTDGRATIEAAMGHVRTDPAPNEPKSLLREPSKPPGKTGVEFVDRLADQWSARQSAALRGDITGIKNADMWLGIIAKEYWGEIIASLQKTHTPPPAEPVSATPRSEGGNWPTPEFTQHIQFEGCDCVVLSPEEYEALYQSHEQIERELAEAKRLAGNIANQLCENRRIRDDAKSRAESAEARAAELQAELEGFKAGHEEDEAHILEQDAAIKTLQAKLAAETDQAHNAAIDAVNGLFTPDGYDISDAARAAILALKVPQ